MTGSNEALENCKNLQAQIVTPSSVKESEDSRNEQVTTSLRIQQVVPMVRVKEVSEGRIERVTDQLKELGETDTNNNHILDLTIRPKGSEVRIGMDPINFSKGKRPTRMNTCEAHAELTLKKYIAEPTRLRKINNLIDTIRELEKQRVMHIQSLEYFKAIQELERLGGTVENNETDSDSRLTDFLSTDSSEEELEKDDLPKSADDKRLCTQCVQKILKNKKDN